MIRVVYDTSVLATMLSRRDLILELQAAIGGGEMALITSPYIIDELERVLIMKFALTKQGAKSRARLLARIAEIAQPKHIKRVARDVNDDPILATSIAGNASHIVTYDNDLLVLKKYGNAVIMNLGRFKEVLVKS